MKELKKELEKELSLLKEQLNKALELNLLLTTIYKIDGKIEAIEYILNKLDNKEIKGGK